MLDWNSGFEKFCLEFGMAWKLQCWEWILQLKLLWLSSSCFSARIFSLLLLWELDNQVPLAGGLEMRRLTVFWSWSGYKTRWSRHWNAQSQALPPPNTPPPAPIPGAPPSSHDPPGASPMPLPMPPPSTPAPRLLQATWEHAQFVGKKRIGEMGAAWIQPALQPGFR